MFCLDSAELESVLFVFQDVRMDSSDESSSRTSHEEKKSVPTMFLQLILPCPRSISWNAIKFVDPC